MAVLPTHPITPLSALDAFDVCVNPLAVVLCVLATAFELQEATKALLVSAVAASSGESSGTAPPSLTFPDDLARGLLYQHGVRATAMTVDDALPVVATEDDSEAEEKENDNKSSRFVIVAASSAADGKALASKLIESGAYLSASCVCVGELV